VSAVSTALAAGGSPGEIVLVTSGDPGRPTGGYLYNRHVLEALRADGLPAIQVVLGERRPPVAIGALRSTLARRRPPLVIVDSIALGAAAPLGAWIKRRLGAGVVALMHMLPSDLAPWWRRPIIRSAERTLLSVADRVVAVSPSLRGRLVVAGAAPDRVVVIPPGRDGLPMPTTPPSDRGGRRFLCVANWSSSKGIHVLVEAMAGLDPCPTLELVGERGDPSYARRVRRSIERRGLGRRVRALGPLEGPALAGRYAAADVFVLPSISEGFGTVYAEAMSFGLPVVACRVGPLPWLVPPDCGILVPPNDAAALARVMGALAADDALRRRMGAAALRRARSLPTWSESGEAFCRLVRDLLSAGLGAGPRAGVVRSGA
jgi:glycosyltransferase involved in cell wall biosynthesis